MSSLLFCEYCSDVLTRGENFTELRFLRDQCVCSPCASKIAQGLMSRKDRLVPKVAKGAEPVIKISPERARAHRLELRKINYQKERVRERVRQQLEAIKIDSSQDRTIRWDKASYERYILENW